MSPKCIRCRFEVHTCEPRLKSLTTKSEPHMDCRHHKEVLSSCHITGYLMRHLRRTKANTCIGLIPEPELHGLVLNKAPLDIMMSLSRDEAVSGYKVYRNASRLVRLA